MNLVRDIEGDGRGPEGDPQQTAIDAKLRAMGLYTAAEAEQDAFGRVLILGPSKQGKTTCCALGMPGVMIINCDGIAATRPAAKAGAHFGAVDVVDERSWKDACTLAVKLASDGTIQTIIVDTVTLLQDVIIDDLQRKGLDGRDLWGRVLDTVMKGLKVLKAANAHLIVIAHQIPGASEAEGVVPMLAGQAQVKVPAIMHDVVLFCYDGSRRHDVEAVQNRWFILGPQAKWQYGSRNVGPSCQIPADMPTLFAELGIPL